MKHGGVTHEEETRALDGQIFVFHVFTFHGSASYLLEFNSSVINWSLVVMTRLAAEKPVEATIRLMNSSERSTLDCSRAPERTPPEPRVSGEAMTGLPLLE